MNEPDNDGPTANDNSGEATSAAPETAAGEADEESAPGNEAAQLKDQLLRALAEVENTRRRAQREVEDARKYAVANFARDVLTVSDNLSRALIAVPDEAAQSEDMKALIEGVGLTERELLSVLERHGIRKIEPMGEKFDPNLHQAMFESDVPGAAPGSVVEVVQSGYIIGERLLRPAMVGVAKKQPAAAGGGDQVDTKA